MDLQLLRAELDAGHPDTGPYSADNQIAADQLNAENRSLQLRVLSGDEIFAATDNTEFAGLTESKQQLWLSFCSRQTIDPFGTANVAFVQWIFGGGSATVSALTGLRTKPISRAVELGIARKVRPGTVGQARAL